MKRFLGKAYPCIVPVMILMIFMQIGIPAHATEATRKALEEAKEALEDTQDQLDDTRGQLEDKKEDISNLNRQKTQMENKLDSLNKDLTEVSDNLSDLEDQIDNKEIEIGNTQEELQLAIETKDAQYEAMKRRIQFIYEKQNFLLFDMLVDVGSFADFLNQRDFVEALSGYDRKMLIEYENTCESISAKEESLKQQKAQLDEYRAEAEAEQSRVAGLVRQASGSINRYKENISTAEEEAVRIEEQAREYEALAESQDEDVKALEAKLAEEIRLSQLAKSSSWRNISDVSFADGDRYLLANLIYCEAGGEPYEGKLAVGAVVMNRVLSSVYPDTVVGVIYQSGQFSPVASGRLALALANGSATDACYQAADQAMSGATNVGNCVYFRTPVPGLSGINIGGHVFY